MSSSFKKLSVLFIINIFIFVSCFIITTRGQPDSICLSPEPLPDDLFFPDKYNRISYAKYVFLDLARHLHQTFGLTKPVDGCIVLSDIDTFYTERGREYVRTDSGTFQLYLMVEETAIDLFNQFNLFGESRNIQLEDHQSLALYTHINVAIRRLYNCGHYRSRYGIIASIRQLKFTFTKNNIHEGLRIAGERLNEPPANTQALLDNELCINARRVFMEQRVTDIPENGSLYVHRNEIAITQKDDKNVRFVGSDRACKCIIVILIHRVTGDVGISNVCDVASSDEVVDEILDKMYGLNYQAETSYSLYLIGGPNVEDLFSALMKCFHLRLEDIHVMLVFVGAFNTNINNPEEHPLITGVAVDLAMLNNPNIFPANFEYRGPDEQLRLAKIIVYPHVMNIYNYTDGLVSIPYFPYNYRKTARRFSKSDEDLEKYYNATIDEVSILTRPIYEKEYF